jgi:hypothetical protein
MTVVGAVQLIEKIDDRGKDGREGQRA